MIQYGTEIRIAEKRTEFMPTCVGVAFKRVARSYWFDPGALTLQEEDRVVVETSRGLELGLVKIAPRSVPDEEIQAPLKRVLRLATGGDLERERENRQKARQAMAICKEAVQRHELPMKLLSAEYTFDAVQVTIYFAAETRVDFRELVRDVAGQLRCKVQLHQVGARDQAKMIGGVGPCGLTLCCSTFLTEFAPISMKMAKDQSLFLNPVKFSGVCGKLMCCLRYEHETYVEAKKKLPQIGEIVMSPKGQGKVVDLNLLKETALVQLLESQVELEFPASELKIEKVGKCAQCRGCSLNQLKADYAETAPDETTRAGARQIAAERVRDFDDEDDTDAHL
jgi:cell fate regulator YaaT (PSP1 superfamily)